MDDEISAPVPPLETMQHVPHDLVFKILLLLDTNSLVRFACVCKSWRDTITGNRCFQREHHRLQDVSVLISPRITHGFGIGASLGTTTPGLYRWERKIRQATLVQAMDSFPAMEEARRHTLAHCHGLVLVPTDRGHVGVLNPATRRVLTLPLSPHGVAPPDPRRRFHRAFGLGHDPRSDTYKVVRFFYRSAHVLSTGVYRYTIGLEVFTIGRDKQWRETPSRPPYPVIAGRTATFFKGSLLWAIDESVNLGKGDMPARGFLRFNLEDESFGFTPAPLGCPDLRYYASNLVEMHGELCIAHERTPKPGPGQPNCGLASIWACSNAELPRWVERHVIDVPLPIRMIAAFDDGRIVFQGRSHTLECFDSQSTLDVRRLTSLHQLRYQHPDTKKLVEYTRKVVHGFDVIPYVPSLVPI